MAASATSNISAAANASASAAPAESHRHLHALLDHLNAFAAHVEELLTQAAGKLEAATLEEILAAIAVPILAGLVGIRLSRWVKRLRKRTFTAWLSEVASPFFVPILTLLFAAIALAGFRASEIEPILLPFELKLAVAWLAMRLVLQMSSQQSAGWVIALVIIPITLLHLFGVWHPLTDAMRTVEFAIGGTKLTLYAVFHTVTSLALLLWLTNALLGLTERRMGRWRGMHVSNRVLVTKIFQIVLYFIVFLVGLRILGVSLTTLSVFSGAVGVGVGFGLQKIASNFISGIILLFEKSVEIGDIITLSDGTTGTIRATAARYTLLEMADGREMLIPNEDFIDQRIISSTLTTTRGRVEIPLTISFDADPAPVLALMIEAAKSYAPCLKSPAPAAYVTGFGDNGLNLSLFFWVEDVHEGVAKPKSEVAQRIWKAFRAANVPIVSTQQIIHLGKTGAPS